MKPIFKLMITLLLLIMESSMAADLQNFVLQVEFTDQNGNGGSAHRAICKCENIHLKNKSVHYNNNPIGNALSTGVYKVYSLSPLYQIATFPANTWNYNEIKTIQICGNFSGQTLNLMVQHFGAGVASGGMRQDKLYLNTFKPTVTVTSNAQACQGESVHLNSTGADSYVWSPNSGLNANNISNPIATLMSSQSYTVTGTKTYHLSLIQHMDTIYFIM